jgi:two-component system, NtrC family, nitrogen regulation sensor histidine kinase NtrY
VNVRRGSLGRGAILAISAAPLFLIALWVRTPVLPQIPAAATSQNETTSEQVADNRALENALSGEVTRLSDRAASALDAPKNLPGMFEYLAGQGPERDDESVVLFERDRPVAWAGRVWIDPDSSPPNPVSVTFSPFYTVLSVSKARGPRRAVALVVVHAAPPADKLVEAMDARLQTAQGVASYEFSPPDSANGGPVVLSAQGRPVLRALPRLAATAEVRFRRAAALRTRGIIVLVALVLAFLIFAWRDRRALPQRLFALAVALAITALVPWNAFSNASRVFDPAYYFSKVGGPLTANAGALFISVGLVLLAVYAVIRALHEVRWPHVYGLIGAVVVLGAGIPIASNIVRGIGQPPWGSTPGLWLAWEIPLFVFLFAVLLLAYWFLQKTLRQAGAISFRAAVILALVAGNVGLAGLWSTTLRQRKQLAEEDVEALAHVDDYALILTERLASAISDSRRPVTAPTLLDAYASSDLAAAEYPAIVAAWDDRANEIVEFAVTDAGPDTGVVEGVVREAVASGKSLTRSVLGPTGVQILAVVRHPTGGVTSILVFPRTKLLRENPYAALFGVGLRGGGEPPYTVSLTDVSPAVPADTGKIDWHRLRDELHGDRVVATSEGTKRAHVEIDLRSTWARGERAFLVLLLDLMVAGLLWLLGALVERGFTRWLRVRAAHWLYTYHARLTLALFAFFVIPALAFAVWSYQRLRSDDMQTKEVLVQETLHAVAAADEFAQLPAAARRFDTPLFLYSNGFLDRSSDSLLEALAPIGRALPADIQLLLASAGEVSAASEERIGSARVLFGYAAAMGPSQEHYVLGAPARSDDLVLDRRRRDLGMLVLFSTALGALAALWLSGIAAKRLARDLELSRIEVARAERVLAWGEMARQVAHEIKNPLTPIRLGVQHLRRARSDPRVNFDQVLNDNVGRILSEIDRLDEIARSFSRYGSAPADLPPAVAFDVALVVRDVADLEQMGDRIVKWQVRGADRSIWAMGRKDEMRDVLLNIFENARLAGARRVEVELREEEQRVTIETIDDGAGIPATVLPRIFEPHFSTRTTGSGLGLAVSRRVIEAWGGEIAITTEEGKGTRVMIVLARREA